MKKLCLCLDGDLPSKKFNDWALSLLSISTLLILCRKMPYHQQSITNSQKSTVLLSLYIHNDILMFSQMGNGNFCALNHTGIYNFNATA